MDFWGVQGYILGGYKEMSSFYLRLTNAPQSSYKPNISVYEKIQPLTITYVGT